MSIKSNLWPVLTQKGLLYLNNPESNFLLATNLPLFINDTVILFWTGNGSFFKCEWLKVKCYGTDNVSVLE